MEKLYQQYFIGLPSYQEEQSFDPSSLILFRKCLNIDTIMDVNAYMFDNKNDDNDIPPSESFSDDSFSAPGQ